MTLRLQKRLSVSISTSVSFKYQVDSEKIHFIRFSELSRLYCRDKITSTIYIVLLQRNLDTEKNG